MPRAIRRIRVFQTISNIAQIFATEISDMRCCKLHRVCDDHTTKRACDVRVQITDDIAQKYLVKLQKENKKF